MANPKIQVDLTADAKGLKKGAKEAGEAVEKLGKDADNAADKIDNAGDKADKAGGKFEGLARGKASEHLGAVGEAAEALGVDLDNVDTKLLAAGAGLAAVAGFAAQGVSKFTEYASEVRRVRTETSASWEESSRLTSTFKDLGLEVDNSAEMMGELARNIDDGKLAEFGIEAVKAKDGTVDLIGTLGNVADAMNRTVDPTRKSAMGAALFGEEWSQLAPLLSRGSAGMKELMGSVEGSRLVTAEADRQAREFEQALRDGQKAVENLQMSLGRQMIPQLAMMAQDLGKVSGMIEKLSGKQAGLNDFFAAFNPISSIYNARLRDQQDKAEAAAKSTEGLATASATLAIEAAAAGAKQRDLAAAEQSAAEKAELLTSRQEDVARSAQDAARGVEAQRSQLEQLRGLVETVAGTELGYQRAVIATKDAQAQLAEKQQAVTDAVNAYGEAAPETAKANDDYAKSVLDAQDAALRQADAEVNRAEQVAIASGATFDAEQSNLVYRDALVRVRDASNDPVLVDGLNGLIGLVDDTARAAGDAEAKLLAAAAAASRLSAEASGALQVTNQGTFTGSADSAAARIGKATGGMTMADVPYRVGESGTEVFVPSSNGRVLSVAQAQQALAGTAGGDAEAASGSATIVVPVYLDGRKIAEATVRPAEMIRRAGR